MKKYKHFIISSFSMVLIFILLWAGIQKDSPVLEVNAKDHPDTHNMLVVGEKTVFLSHLPMFPEEGHSMMPHRYQVILEASFEKQGSKPEDDYFKDRLRHPAIKIYTLNPKRFVLPALMPLNAQVKPLREFEGTVFRGHLEKLQNGEDSILSDVMVTVKRVVHFREFDAKMKKPAQLEYLLFGKGQELFLAHFITAPPDFDQVLSIKVTGHNFSDEELAKGMKIGFPASTNTSSTRLKEKQQIEGELNLDGASAPKKIQVQVEKEFYFEEGELQVPAEFMTTPEEKKAGFP